ncbi:hypothetical protein [Agreia sp. VKM Ac-1783]|uniref:hypothetical protein n=1 Tax=Agreia sp. VKM Ac-1783 TaxID=1938889 RepID=UPI000A2AA46C|nr:hypothetical protein [Agreia sp. VKM Ac-1783]SMQ71881.1 hypothetical protein SAMN06295943_2768 [Agreia sp. VKM Ac-1783]
MNESENPSGSRHAAHQETAHKASELSSTKTGGQTARHLERIHERIGDALYAYLTLPDTDSSTPSFEDDFYSDFRGEYATLTDILHAQLDGLGWAHDLLQFTKDHAIPENILNWDFGLIKAQMDEIYEFVEYKNQIYLFLR